MGETVRDETVRNEAFGELTRPEPRRSIFARFATVASSRESRPPEDDPVAQVVRRVRDGSGVRAGATRWLTTVAVAVLFAVGVGTWSLLRRSPDPTAALPRATADAAGAVDRRPDSTPTSTVIEPRNRGTAMASGGASSSVTVHVAGAVGRPGVVSLRSGSRAVDAVDAAGGLAPGADADRVNLAAPLVDGERLVIPLLGQPAPVEVVPQVPDPDSGSDPMGSNGPVDLNTASVADLDALPGIGPATAQAIVAHREERGPFASVEGLLDVRGIGDAKLASLRDLVVAGG